MAKQDKLDPLMFHYPDFYIDPLTRSVKQIERIVSDSGLPYNMEYRPDDGYFSVELYKGTEEK